MEDQNEYEREQQLINQINALQIENAQLQADLNVAADNVQILTGNVGTLETNVYATMSKLNHRVEAAAEDVTVFLKALRNLADQYFAFKNLSTASKNLTRYTDEYYTRFSFYHKLRRITLGYVIGLDHAIISNQALQQEVEKAYLQNTDYWLAYAITAVMLWSKDEREAANRALYKALSMDYHRSCVFFLLINLRFERTQAAKDWYLNYLDKVDMSKLGDEFQYLLQAYLNGLFGHDRDFEILVSDNLSRLLQQTEATSAGFGDKFTDGAAKYAKTFLHRTEETFPTLKEVSSDYQQLMDLLSNAEKHTYLAQLYVKLAEETVDLAQEQAQRVENVLYGLINSYDDTEWRVVKEQKRNEAIMEARGDLKAAQDKFDLIYAHVDEKKPMSDMMVTWAFSEDPSQTNLTVKRFTISMMKDRIYRGFENFAQQYRKLEPDRCHLDIDGCELLSDEKSLKEQSNKLSEYFNKNRFKNILADTQVKIYGILCLAALLVLLITIFAFSLPMLTIGILVGALGGFLLWRRVADVSHVLAEKSRLAQVKLGQALEEFGRWRKLYQEADGHLPDVEAALNRF